jgi:hypothetical protein
MRFVFFLLVSGIIPSSLRGQTDASDSSTSQPRRRQNAWVSGGVGVGTGGIGAVASVWYSYNHLVVGAHKTYAAPFIGRDVRDTGWLIGVRDLAKRRIVLAAAGPAKFEGLRHRGDNDPSTVVPAVENGVAVAAEAVFTFGTRGVGTDLFAGRSKNRSIAGATFSIQLGWLGN